MTKIVTVQDLINELMLVANKDAEINVVRTDGEYETTFCPHLYDFYINDFTDVHPDDGEPENRVVLYMRIIMFTTPCFVKIDDAHERAEIIKWLTGIGYTFNACYNNAYEVAISPNSITRVIKVERRAESNFIDAVESSDIGIDCGTNIDLFKALAALRDDSDYMQWFVRDEPHDLFGKWIICEGDNWESDFYSWADNSYSLNMYHKATSDELVEYFTKVWNRE